MKKDKHEVVVVDRAVPGEWEKVTDIVGLKVFVYCFFLTGRLLTR